MLNSRQCERSQRLRYYQKVKKSSIEFDQASTKKERKKGFHLKMLFIRGWKERKKERKKERRSKKEQNLCLSLLICLPFGIFLNKKLIGRLHLVVYKDDTFPSYSNFLFESSKAIRLIQRCTRLFEMSKGGGVLVAFQSL